MIKKTDKKIQNELIIFLVLSTLLVPFEYYTSGVRAYIYNICRYLPLLGCIYFALKLFKRNLSVYEFILFSYSIILFVLGLFNVATSYIGSISYIFINLYVIIAILISDYIEDEILFKAFEVTSIVGIVAFVWFYFHQGFDLSMILGQSWSRYVWTESFYYCSLLWATPYFVLLSHIKNKYVSFSTLVWAVYIIFNLVFLKRYAFVDSMLMGACLLIHYMNTNDSQKSKRLMKFGLLILLALCVAFSVFGDSIIEMFNSMLNRAATTSKDVSSFDRFLETKDYFSQCGILKLLFGGGFYNYFYSASEQSIRYNLHVGWSDFIFKGGLVYLGIILASYIHIPFGLKNYKALSKYSKFVILAALMNTVRFFYSDTYAFYPSMLIAFLIFIGLTKLEIERCNEINNYV